MEIKPPPVQECAPEKKITDDAQMIADLVTGINMRKKDNRIQGLSVLAGCLLGALVGLIWGYVEYRAFNANLLGPLIVGFLGGALVSLLISGAILGVYRTFKH